MTLAELVALVQGFDSLSPKDQIRILAWHLHAHKKADAFGSAEIRTCYREINMTEPNVSVYLPRMAESGDLLRSREGYRLARAIRIELDKQYGQNPTTVAVAKILTDLPAKVPDIAERAFLDEAIKCYRVGAFRAAIVMTWNLAYDHLTRWVFADPTRLAKFNAAVAKRYPSKKGLVITKIDDYEDLKESETLEICNSAGLYSGDITKILKGKLDRRNTAAHPSQVAVTQAQADDTITDLVNNVVLALK